MELGLTFEKKFTVAPEMTASSLKTGTVPVFSSPVMFAYMEACCVDCVKPYLNEGEATVGIQLNVAHTAATPPGVEITVTCKLIAQDRRKLTFSVEAHTAIESIGNGFHDRFIVDEAKFLDKMHGKYGK